MVKIRGKSAEILFGIDASKFAESLEMITDAMEHAYGFYWKVTVNTSNFEVVDIEKLGPRK